MPRFLCLALYRIDRIDRGKLDGWASHEWGSAFRREIAHRRSLISHSRLAVSVSCASGLGGVGGVDGSRSIVATEICSEQFIICGFTGRTRKEGAQLCQARDYSLSHWYPPCY